MNCSHLGTPYSISVHHFWIFPIVFDARFVLYPKGRSHQVESGDVLAFWSSSKHPIALFGVWGVVAFGLRGGCVAAHFLVL